MDDPDYEFNSGIADLELCAISIKTIQQNKFNDFIN